MTLTRFLTENQNGAYMKNRIGSLFQISTVGRGSLAALVVAASMTAASSTAFATIVCNTVDVPVAIPNDINGIYLNLVTGATGTSGAAVAGWDQNPYNNGAGLTFYSPNDGSGLIGSPTQPPNGGTASLLGAGVTVGPAATYTGAFQTAGTQFWVTSTTSYAGIRFMNEGTATVNYGWLQFSTTAPTGYPVSLDAYCYQNDGTSIVTGVTTPVTLQSFSVD
jgi:hypothetical protein